MNLICRVLSRLAVLLPILFTSTTVCAQAVTLETGDTICIVGNTLGERMQHHNYWETMLHQRFPARQLSVRNLCFPADEITVRPRSLNFGSPDDHLRHSQADVVFFMFGFNESFQGLRGLGKFEQQLRDLIQNTQSQNYNGQSPPRIVLVSPIAVEDMGNPLVPNGASRNAILDEYVKRMEKVAAETQVGFANVFQPTLELFASSDENLTLDSIHLTDAGYRAFAPLLDAALFGAAQSTPTIDKKLLAAVNDKSFHWWNRYRAVNGFSIYGKRGEAGYEGTYNNRDVMERERAILDQMCANRDERIWKIAQGEAVPAKVDDSNTLPFLQPRTNLGTSHTKGIQDGDLGSLDYITSQEQLKHFKLPPGYEIDIFATEEHFPELVNPVAINFDSQGRLWVATMESYPHWQPKTKMDDKLLIFEDADGDGHADVCKTFAGGLHQPTGFELGHGGAYVAMQPDILFLEDTDGDDVADVRTRQLVGFDSADTHHGLGACEWSPGGVLHCMEGIFKFSGIETYHGPIRSDEGAVWRYDPRSRDFGIYSTFNFTNPWGHVFDSWGQDFITDGTSGQHFYVTPISGHTDYPLRHRGRREMNDAKPYPQFLKKVARPSAGVEIVSSRNFPDEAQGNYLVNNCIGLLGVMQYEIQDEDSGFGGDYIGNLVESTYGNFRPVDLQFGPDGALYICDWHNALIGHLQHNLRDPNRDHSHGRIWRVTYKGRPLVESKDLESLNELQLCEQLAAPEDRARYRVRRELAARETDDVTAALQAWLSSLSNAPAANTHQQLEALWVQQSHHSVDEQLLQELLTNEDFRARAAATRVLVETRSRWPDALQQLKTLANDEHPRVRLEAVRGCSFFRTADAAEVALEVLNHPMDQYLQYTLDETMRQLDQL